MLAKASERRLVGGGGGGGPRKTRTASKCRSPMPKSHAGNTPIRFETGGRNPRQQTAKPHTALCHLSNIAAAPGEAGTTAADATAPSARPQAVDPQITQAKKTDAAWVGTKPNPRAPRGWFPSVDFVVRRGSEAEALRRRRSQPSERTPFAPGDGTRASERGDEGAWWWVAKEETRRKVPSPGAADGRISHRRPERALVWSRLVGGCRSLRVRLLGRFRTSITTAG